MRKEAVNTFDKGVVFDLNPLTTPNNVLTDALNSTFITFNGDELSLQNDAGNAPIPILNNGVPIVVNGIPEEVKLSDGFFPLGIKEYGGVLYIVSGKLPDILPNNIPKWLITSSYIKGNIVYNNLVIKTFYEAKENTNQPLPIESNQYWKVIGTEEDYNNTYGQVEFGSYPSPEARGQKDIIGDKIDYNDLTVYNTATPTLYKYTTINSGEFKSGRYVSFSSIINPINSVGGEDNLSNYVWNVSTSKANYSPKFYKLGLYHQLSNGYLDLTPDIWDRYITKLGSNLNIAGQNSNTWFKDNTFIYYCYSRFKGKLALFLEIENLYEFKLSGTPSIGLNVDSSYNFTLNTSAIPTKPNDPTLNITSGTITIPKVKIDIWIDGVQVVYGLEILTVNNVAVYNTLTIPASSKDKLLKYQITPILGNAGAEYNKQSLPVEFINKYTINGTMLVNTIYDNISFRSIFTNVSTCTGGFQTFNEYLLVNSNDDPIDPVTFEVSPTIKYVFLKSPLTVPMIDPAAVILGSYTVDNITNKPIITPTAGISDTVVSLFGQITVVKTCATSVKLTLNFNRTLTLADSITIYQYGYPTVVKNITGVSTVVDIVSGVGTTVTVSKSGYEDVTQSGSFLIDGSLQFNFIDTVWYWKLTKCNGTLCYMTNDTKISLQSGGMTFSSGDRFYGAIENDPNYLYLFTSQSVYLSNPPSCIVTGLTKTLNTCP